MTTTTAAEPAAPVTGERIDLPGGWYFEAIRDGTTIVDCWSLYRPDGLQHGLLWRDDYARAFAAAMAPVMTARPAEATGDAERVATRHRLREIILGWSGMDESDLGPIVDAIMREVVVPVEQARDAAEGRKRGRRATPT